MKEEKVYRSKLGAQFKISDHSRPSEGDVVYFTRAEYEYMQQKKFTPQLFYGAYLIKKGDYQWSPITKEDQESQAEMSARLAKETIEMLKGNHRK